MSDSEILILPHGLGDIVQALPALHAYAEYRGEKLRIAAMHRIPAIREVLDAQLFVADVIPIGDPWNEDLGAGSVYEPDTRDFFLENCAHLEREARRAYGVPARVIYASPPDQPEHPLMNKYHRFADNLGVAYNGERPDLSFLDETDYAEGFAHGAACRVGREHARMAVTHGSSGNPAKDVMHGTLAEIARSAIFGGFFSFAVPVDASRSLAWNAGLIASADAFVGVDSGPAHVASAVGRNVLWVFTTTLIQQAFPLYSEEVRAVAVGPHRFELVRSWRAWCEANGVTNEGRAVVGAGI